MATAPVESLALYAPAPPPASDLPPVPPSIDGDLRDFLTSAREALQELAGWRGDAYNRAVRWADMVQNGFANKNYGPAFLGGIGPAGPIGPTGPAGTYTPDTTPPPSVTGLTAAAGLTSIIVQWGVAVYTQGHGPKQTNIYAAKKAAADPTLPTFGDAVKVASAPHALTIIDIASDTSIRWHLWAKFETVDSIESTSPAGGTNGVVVQTGKIGNVDLGDLIITAEKLSAGTYPNINLVSNGSAEDGTVAWKLTEKSGGGTDVLSVDTAIKAGGSQAFKMDAGSDGTFAAWGCLAFPVIPGETYSVKWKVRGNVALAAGHAVEMNEGATKPATGWIGAPGNVGTTARVGTTSVSVGSVNLTTSFVAYEGTYVPSAGTYWATPQFRKATNGSGLTTLYVDDVSVGRQITASFLAAGSIAVGTAAIAAGAIVNAMIGTAAIDDAKIANLSASKLTVGTGVIGGDLKSSNYVFGTSGWLVQPGGYAEFGAAAIRGQLTASQIDTRNLTIKDAAGNIVFSAGANNYVVSPNVVKNPTARLGLRFWTLFGTPAAVTSLGGAGDGPYFFMSSAVSATGGASSDFIPMPASVTVFLQAEMFSAGLTAGNWVMDLDFYNSSFVSIGGGPYARYQQGTPQNWTRLSSSVVSPAGTAWVRVRFFMEVAVSTSCAVRKIKLEAGAQLTPFSDEATGGDVTTETPQSPAWLTSPVVWGSNPINAGNVSTFIANAAIQTAQIANLAVDNAQINTAAVTTLKLGTGAATSMVTDRSFPAGSQAFGAVFGTVSVPTPTVNCNAAHIAHLVGMVNATAWPATATYGRVTAFSEVNPNGAGYGTQNGGMLEFVITKATSSAYSLSFMAQYQLIAGQTASFRTKCGGISFYDSSGTSVGSGSITLSEISTIVLSSYR